MPPLHTHTQMCATEHTRSKHSYTCTKYTHHIDKHKHTHTIPTHTCTHRPFMLQSRLSFSQIGIFSLATYPYSFKLLWSPIVDSWYSTRLGRRKSWIVPVQVSAFTSIRPKILYCSPIHHLRRMQLSNV